MAVDDAHVFPDFFTPVLTQLFFPKPPTTFLTCFCRGEMRKYAGKKSRLTRGSNSQPPGHGSDTLTTESPWRDELLKSVVQVRDDTLHVYFEFSFFFFVRYSPHIREQGRCRRCGRCSERRTTFFPRVRSPPYHYF